MTTTTVRVDAATHAQLLEMSAATGATLIDTVRDAAAALHRERFARQVANELAELRQHPDSWADYLADAEATHVTDGVS
jgi:hypothetical protein